MQFNFDSESWNQWQEMIERIAAMQSEMLKVSLSPAIKQIQESVDQITKQHRKILQDSIKPMVEQIGESTKKLSDLNKISGFQTLLETIAKEAEEMPEHVDKVHAYLAQQGWFVPFHMAPISKFREYSVFIDNKEYELIERDLQDYIRTNFNFIKSSAKKQFPNRYRIIDTAIKAHENGNYLLSIPTLLAQADGMFSELIDKTFYSNKESDLEDIRRRLLKKLASKGHPTNTSSLGYLLIKQLQEKSVLHDNFDEFEKRKAQNSEVNSLNRNYILHGKDLSYDTEPNGLRAIALIGLLCDCKDTLSP